MIGRKLRQVRITTCICERHFPILRYESRSMINVKRVFNKLNCKFPMGETWFLELDRMIFSLSFNLFDWSKYKSMIYEKGISKEFRVRCMKDRYGSLAIKSGSAWKLLCKFNECSKNQELKDSIDNSLTKVMDSSYGGKKVERENQ